MWLGRITAAYVNLSLSLEKRAPTGVMVSTDDGVRSLMCIMTIIMVVSGVPRIYSLPAFSEVLDQDDDRIITSSLPQRGTVIHHSRVEAQLSTHRPVQA